jgi:hypothetical protein
LRSAVTVRLRRELSVNAAPLRFGYSVAWFVRRIWRILEALYDSLGIGALEWRARLSRASDEILFRVARNIPGAILVSFWRHDGSPDALRALGKPLVEVHCRCDPDTARARFTDRARHEGHLDHLKEWALPKETGPLMLGGPLIVVDTSGPVDLDGVSAEVRQVTSQAVW